MMHLGVLLALYMAFATSQRSQDLFTDFTDSDLKYLMMSKPHENLQAVYLISNYDQKVDDTVQKALDTLNQTVIDSYRFRWLNCTQARYKELCEHFSIKKNRT